MKMEAAIHSYCEQLGVEDWQTMAHDRNWWDEHTEDFITFSVKGSNGGLYR